MWRWWPAVRWRCWRSLDAHFQQCTVRLPHGFHNLRLVRPFLAMINLSHPIVGAKLPKPRGSHPRRQEAGVPARAAETEGAFDLGEGPDQARSQPSRKRQTSATAGRTEGSLRRSHAGSSRRSGKPPRRMDGGPSAPRAGGSFSLFQPYFSSMEMPLLPILISMPEGFCRSL